MTVSLINRLNRLLLQHSAFYPHMQVQDVYKLLYQAAIGNGHAIPDETRAKIWLEEEMSNLTPDANQPLVELISPEIRMERRIVRINLRSYLVATDNIESLLEATLCTANEFVGSLRRLEQFASLVSQIPTEADLHFSKRDFANYMSKMRSRNYPSIHHSEIYTRWYQPAYRVVAHKFLKSMQL